MVRFDAPLWQQWLPVRVRAMVKTADKIFVAGPPDIVDPDDPLAAFKGRKGAILWAVSPENGGKLGNRHPQVAFQRCKAIVSWLW